MKESIKKVLDIADKTYYNWKKENRPIISLLEKYFTKEDLEEFLSTNKIAKYDVVNTSIFISISNFVEKLNILYTKDSNPILFYNFIVHYVQLDKSYYFHDVLLHGWVGIGDLEEFQDEFYEYLIKNITSASELKNMSYFINQLTISDLLFLNMNISTGFRLTFNTIYINFHHTIIDDRSLDKMKDGLYTAFSETLKIDDDLNNLITELIDETRDRMDYEYLYKT